MALVVNTNVTALRTRNALNAATNGASQAMHRMSTGYKINSAGDNAAGFMISKGLQTQISGSDICVDNAQNGINILQTAEGTLDTIQDNLLRMRDLCLQSMNGGYSQTEIQALSDEAAARALEIDRIADSSKFNNFQIFDKTKTATASKMLLQVGTGAAEATNTIGIENVFYGATLSCLTGDTSFGSTALTFAGKDRAGMEEILTKLDTAIQNASARRGQIGVSINRLESAIDAQTVQKENLTSSYSSLVDADIAEESAEYTKQYILQQATTSLLAQANQTPSLALSLI
ncbi:flagellin FliC [bacterium]|nr:flagellin FliC [bacterium]